ncbi:NUDIX domain-containing protein, partial [Corynebacterium striatum]
MSHDFEVVGSELLLDAPIIAVRRDEVVMPGGTTAFREVVEHFGAVAIVAIDDAERIAMVDQYRRSVDRRLWELPAGLLDIKGEDELTGARRELQEEAGLAAQDWSVLADIITSPGFCEEAVRVFLARDLSEAPRLAAEGDEEADMGFAWVALDDAVDQVISGEI